MRSSAMKDAFLSLGAMKASFIAWPPRGAGAG
jgi:hypothetical protein